MLPEHLNLVVLHPLCYRKEIIRLLRTKICSMKSRSNTSPDSIPVGRIRRIPLTTLASVRGREVVLHWPRIAYPTTVGNVYTRHYWRRKMFYLITYDQFFQSPFCLRNWRRMVWIVIIFYFEFCIESYVETILIIESPDSSISRSLKIEYVNLTYISTIYSPTLTVKDLTLH